MPARLRNLIPDFELAMVGAAKRSGVAMDAIPRRQSLVSQTAAILRDQIEGRAWTEFLPGERSLCQTLQVSRNTLRAALAQLTQEGLLRPEHGSGNRITVQRTRKTVRVTSHNVALLTPEAIERLRPSQTLWIDELRAMLSERGCQLHVFSGTQYFQPNPTRALNKLTATYPHSCWILTLSKESTQSWFERNGLPCVVAGSVYQGLKLPFRDLDHRAVCRHAAGTLLGLGHRRLAMIMQKSRRAGDLESEAGFLEGVRQSPQADADVAVSYHDATLPSICNVLRRLMDQKSPPTALLVANAYHYLAVVTRLMQIGLRVPDEISVISRDNDPFMDFVLPPPARYITSPHTMARTLMRPVLELVEGGAVTHRGIRIMPDFVKGSSIAGPAPTS